MPRFRVAAAARVLVAAALALTLAPAAARATAPTPDPAAGWHGRAIAKPHHDAASARSGRPRAGWSAGPVGPGTGLHRAHGSRRVRELQRGLRRLGYRPGPVDGIFGPRTQAATTWFQIKHGLSRSGTATLATIAHRPPAPPRSGTASPPMSDPHPPRLPRRPQCQAAATSTGGPGSWPRWRSRSRAARPWRAATPTSRSAAGGRDRACSATSARLTTTARPSTPTWRHSRRNAARAGLRSRASSPTGSTPAAGASGRGSTTPLTGLTDRRRPRLPRRRTHRTDRRASGRPARHARTHQPARRRPGRAQRRAASPIAAAPRDAATPTGTRACLTASASSRPASPRSRTRSATCSSKPSRRPERKAAWHFM